ncbi:MAG TPA: baseplate J/gp47 family protein [Bosea sp. (in: a-proteobacteria)]|jgi:uncharacterized phage protein gp47/JayE|uniref:baseplate J/gp47 family protein n=1 Tax=Bosea sp. (in: a-proteobacteria) TaxID=1871050 RepID=UPI002DDD76CF|nr:baseplate J/gp47 family protein [Bosea sp. (in: a-proteobacteria)]HEV2556799.1 baseplate J/gp47 family protein [Bosea sp. (in: a-proteobacteria)]
MPFPLSSPEELAESQAVEMAAALKALRPDVEPLAIDRAVRSEKGLVAAHVRTDAIGLYETHLHLRWWGDQYMPDTAELEALIRHGSIWGVYQRAATKAVGFAAFTGTPGLAIPLGLQLRTPGGALVETSEAGVVGDGGSVTLALVATEGGTAGNTAGGATLPIVTALAGLDPQAATLDGDGLKGGAAEETPASLLERLLAVIREPGHGGADFDYPNWVRSAFAASKVKTIANWVGPGSVGVAVAMGTALAPEEPSPAEIAAIATHLEGLRPVTAELHVLAYLPLVVPFTLAITPDTLANRAAAQAALADHFAREATIGGRMELSRISEAVSAANGEYAHRIESPAAAIAPAPRELPLLGAITWEAWS